MPPESCNHAGKKVWIFAGESSGDIYGARLAEELRSLESTVQLQGMGGAAMRQAGVDILVDSTELGIVGFIEVLKHLSFFRAIFRQLVDQAAATRPDVVVLIDYPGFNIRFAREMEKLGIRVVYYVSPQVWAWGKRRIPELARLVTRMLVIFPFERNVYDSVSLDTRFVGHPLIRILREQCPAGARQRSNNLVLLLPGSRFSEVDRLTVPLVQTALRLHRLTPSYRFVIAAPRAAIGDRVQGHIDGMGNGEVEALPLSIEVGQTVELMATAAAGVAASGTVTVQAAILGLPIVVVYRLNPLSYLLGKYLVKVPHIAMANLVIGEELFEEYIQEKVQPDRLCTALQRILPGGERRDAVLTGMDRVVEELGGDKNASRTAAEAVLDVIK
ncbi:MAG: lipid-A-disaccharide synthase [Lentisphaeria bacterium]|jgi:lipid-A-disaccharide synthase|nr:lipid-A-disaccharide synthase [Lentisphaeria bacterium]MDP7743310.1 lipid-A-disaccharide synthase [Lentisphaeria bacterium]